MTPITSWQDVNRAPRQSRGRKKGDFFFFFFRFFFLTYDGSRSYQHGAGSTSACVGTAGATRAADKEPFQPSRSSSWKNKKKKKLGIEEF